jgi:hypothetical protein
MPDAIIVRALCAFNGVFFVFPGESARSARLHPVRVDLDLDGWFPASPKVFQEKLAFERKTRHKPMEGNGSVSSGLQRAGRDVTSLFTP